MIHTVEFTDESGTQRSAYLHLHGDAIEFGIDDREVVFVEHSGREVHYVGGHGNEVVHTPQRGR